MASTFHVIARKLNIHNECDFLTALDHPRGSWCLGAMRAMRFATSAEAEAAWGAMQRANPGWPISIMEMTDAEARKPGFWTIRDAWREPAQRKADAPLMARKGQEFDLSALPLFGDQARQLDIMDFLKG